jgi:hypothetical protein
MQYNLLRDSIIIVICIENHGWLLLKSIFYSKTNESENGGISICGAKMVQIYKRKTLTD